MMELLDMKKQIINTDNNDLNNNLVQEDKNEMKPITNNINYLNQINNKKKLLFSNNIVNHYDKYKDNKNIIKKKNSFNIKSKTKSELFYNRNDKPIIKKNTVSHNMTLEQFLRKSEVQKEFIRVNLKAKAFKLITEGVSSLDKTKSIIEEFEKLFVQNPEKERFLPEDKHYLFNQRLSNGKTLLYIACQEGATEIVKYFLEKRLNPNIKAIYYDMEDTCLAVAVRWNFYDIVKLILESNRIDSDDIEETLENENCNEKIKNLLFSHIPDDRKKKKGCGCF